jgi:hypothetical protein
MMPVSFSHWGMFPVYALRVVEDADGQLWILPEDDYQPDIGWMPHL